MGMVRRIARWIDGMAAPGFASPAGCQPDRPPGGAIAGQLPRTSRRRVGRRGRGSRTRGRAAFVARFLGCGLAALLSGEMPLAAAWAPAVQVPGASSLSNLLSSRAIAISGDQSIAVAYRVGIDDVKLAYRPGASGSWTTTTISVDTASSEPLVLTNTLGDLAVVWHGFGYVFARYRPAGAAWESTATLEITANSQFVRGDVEASMNEKGDVLVAWTAYSPGADRYEIHTAARPKAGPWPPTGGFEIAGGPTDVRGGEIEVGLDDAGNALLLWSEPYATIDSGSTSLPAYVLRGALRPPGGPWGSAFDLSERGAESGSVPCSESVPALPSASRVDVALEPRSGNLVVAYAFDPTAGEWDPAVSDCWPSHPDVVLRHAEGSTTAPPSVGDWLQIGSGLIDMDGGAERAVTVDLRNGWVQLGWVENLAGAHQVPDHHVLFARYELGIGNLSLPLDHAAGPEAVHASFAQGGDGRAVALVEEDLDPNPGVGDLSLRAWSANPGGPLIGPTEIHASPNLVSASGVASTCEGYAAAAVRGADWNLYVAEFGGGTPTCLIFTDGFETGNPVRWSLAVP